MAPLSTQRADRFAATLATTTPHTVLDVGCGWGELLLRIVAASGANGTGIDTDGRDLTRARKNAAARGLARRVTFIEGTGPAHATSADVVVNIGAYQAFGGVSDALRALRALVNPRGRLLFGAEMWQRPPTPQDLANMWPGISADDCTDLPGLVDHATAAGFRPLRIETATSAEWEEFESGLAAEGELWLLGNADDPAADAVRTKLDAQRNIWLSGHRDVMGFAYLTLGVPS